MKEVLGRVCLVDDLDSRHNSGAKTTGQLTSSIDTTTFEPIVKFDDSFTIGTRRVGIDHAFQ